MTDKEKVRKYLKKQKKAGVDGFTILQLHEDLGISLIKLQKIIDDLITEELVYSGE